MLALSGVICMMEIVVRRKTREGSVIGKHWIVGQKTVINWSEWMHAGKKPLETPELTENGWGTPYQQGWR